MGAATAREILLRHPKLRTAILEKEDRLAKHQSGHNSGVIHAGIYYKPGTLKAKLCVEGMQLVYRYCEENGIPYKKVGKLIVATDKIELDRLKDLHDRALKNGVPDLRVVDENGIREIEPHCKGLMALHSPHTGIVDFALVTEYYGKDFQKGGGDIHLNFEVGFGKDRGSLDVTSLVVCSCSPLASYHTFCIRFIAFMCCRSSRVFNIHPIGSCCFRNRRFRTSEKRMTLRTRSSSPPHRGRGCCASTCSPAAVSIRTVLLR